MQTVFENPFVCVQANSADEVFVQTPSGVKVRVTPSHDQITITSQNGVIEPASLYNLPAITVSVK